LPDCHRKERTGKPGDLKDAADPAPATPHLTARAAAATPPAHNTNPRNGNRVTRDSPPLHPNAYGNF